MKFQIIGLTICIKCNLQDADVSAPLVNFCSDVSVEYDDVPPSSSYVFVYLYLELNLHTMSIFNIIFVVTFATVKQL